jgi:hypothetical protein
MVEVSNIVFEEIQNLLYKDKVEKPFLITENEKMYQFFFKRIVINNVIITSCNYMKRDIEKFKEVK